MKKGFQTRWQVCDCDLNERTSANKRELVYTQVCISAPVAKRPCRNPWWTTRGGVPFFPDIYNAFLTNGMLIAKQRKKNVAISADQNAKCHEDGYHRHHWQCFGCLCHGSFWISEAPWNPKCKNSEGHNKNSFYNFCFSGLVKATQFRFAAAFASRPSTELVGTWCHNKTKQEPAIIVHHFPSFQNDPKRTDVEIGWTWWNCYGNHKETCYATCYHLTQDPQHLHPTREEHATDTQRNHLRDRCYLLLLHTLSVLLHAIDSTILPTC